ncbi:hypothetical protein AE23_05076, partial [Klebsiella pneumoniae UCI 64]
MACRHKISMETANHTLDEKFFMPKRDEGMIDEYIAKK